MIPCPLCDGYLDIDSLICSHCENAQGKQLCNKYYGHCKKESDHEGNCGDSRVPALMKRVEELEEEIDSIHLTNRVNSERSRLG